MATFQCPARYRRYVEAELARLAAKIENDVECRELDLERFAPVDSDQIDDGATGEITVFAVASDVRLVVEIAA